MLTQIAPGVHVHESECIQSNTVVVDGPDGVLLIDPGLTTAELEGLASELAARGQRVVAGFSTHPDWDHALWHPRLGDAPRYATSRAAESLRDLLAKPDWIAQVAEGLPPEIADDVPMALFGLVTALPAGATTVPWNGPAVRVLEHRGHAPGHAALLIESSRVLAAGDMLSDVLVPMPGLHGEAADPAGDYLAGLALLETVADAADHIVPGHGSVGGPGSARQRIELDRAYLESVVAGREVDDPRLGPTAKPGWEWVQFLHDGNVEALGPSR